MEGIYETLSFKTKIQQFLPCLSHQPIDPISPCPGLAPALAPGGTLPDNIFLHLTITGYNTLPATGTLPTLTQTQN